MSHACPMCDARAKQQQIALLRNKGLTFREIGAHLKVSSASAFRSLKRHQAHQERGK